MQATLPVRTWNTTPTGLVGLVLATIIVFGAAIAFGSSRTLPTAVDQPATQTIEQSVVNRAVDDRAHAAPAVGPRSQVEAPLHVDPDAAGAGARNRIVNVPQ